MFSDILCGSVDSGGYRHCGGKRAVSAYAGQLQLREQFCARRMTGGGMLYGGQQSRPVEAVGGGRDGGAVRDR